MAIVIKNNQFISNMQYEFKKRFGGKVKIINTTASVVDYTTGVPTNNIVNTETVKATILPITLRRSEQQSLMYDENQIDILINFSDIKELTLTPNSFIEYKSVQYSIVQLKMLEDDRTYHVTLARVVGARDVS